jgi:predicted Zn-ribbon and HTH transcriptional regulator
MVNNISSFKEDSLDQFLNLNFKIKRRDVEMADKTLACKDCGKEFVFTEGEQEFYKEKGFENEPQRCPDCRRARKQQNNRGFRK